MSDKTLSQVIGGGGAVLTRAVTAYQQIASGVSGTILTLTPPAGQRVILEYLLRFSNGTESNITINLGGEPIITNGNLGDASGTPVVGNFYIGDRTTVAGNINASTSPVIGGVNETLEVIKTSGTTGSIIAYSYKFGD